MIRPQHWPRARGARGRALTSSGAARGAPIRSTPAGAARRSLAGVAGTRVTCRRRSLASPSSAGVRSARCRRVTSQFRHVHHLCCHHAHEHAHEHDHGHGHGHGARRQEHSQRPRPSQWQRLRRRPCACVVRGSGTARACSARLWLLRAGPSPAPRARAMRCWATAPRRPGRPRTRSHTRARRPPATPGPRPRSLPSTPGPSPTTSAQRATSSHTWECVRTFCLCPGLYVHAAFSPAPERWRVAWDVRRRADGD